MSVSTISSGAASETNGQPTCKNCGTTESWNGSSWCPVCGFYPTLNRTLNAEHVQAAEVSDESDPLRLPQWAIVALAGAALIIVASVVTRLAIAEDGTRAPIAFWMFVTGTLSFSVAQVLAFMYAYSKPGSISIFDMVIRPVELWRHTFLDMPKGQSRALAMIWGSLLVVCGLVVVGGIDYDAFFKNMKVKKQKKPNLIMKAVTSARVPSSNAASLEEAMDEFAGAASADQMAADAADNATAVGDEEDEEGVYEEEEETEEDEEAKEKRRKAREEQEAELKRQQAHQEALDQLPSVECVVMGYCPDAQGGMRCLVLAGVVNNKLRCLGLLPARTVPAEVRTVMLSRLQKLEQKAPFVPTLYNGIWVRPKVRCRIAYKSLTPDGRIKGAYFKEHLADLGAE